jgi:serine protease inhibitor
MLNRRTLLALGALSLAGCTGEPDDPDPGLPPGRSVRVSQNLAIADVEPAAADPAALAAATKAVSAFTGDLYPRVAPKLSGNMVISPLSVATALGMTLQGARGETAEQMRAVLHADSDAGIAAGLGSLRQALASRSGPARNRAGDQVDVQLREANSLWGQRRVRWEEPFLTGLARWFAAGLNLVDYANPEQARGAINDWVSEQTRGRIPELVPRGALDGDSRLTLVNAIWFKAGWQLPFEPHGTRTQPFTRVDGTRVDTPMMSGSGQWFTEGRGWRAADLRYAGEQLAMTVVLPDAGHFAEIERTMDGDWLRRLVTGLRHLPVRLELPRWKVRSQVDLGPALSALGMPLAFAPRADFSGMTRQDRLHVSAVLHEGWIAVDEHGTEAAAATAVIMATVSAAAFPQALVADRPFLFVLRDVPTGTPLFLGRVTDPTV